MELIVIVVVLFVLVDGVYRWWIDEQESDREQPMSSQLAASQDVYQPRWKVHSPPGDR